MEAALGIGLKAGGLNTIQKRMQREPQVHLSNHIYSVEGMDEDGYRASRDQAVPGSEAESQQLSAMNKS